MVLKMFYARNLKRLGIPKIIKLYVNVLFIYVG